MGSTGEGAQDWVLRQVVRHLRWPLSWEDPSLFQPGLPGFWVPTRERPRLQPVSPFLLGPACGAEAGWKVLTVPAAAEGRGPGFGFAGSQTLALALEDLPLNLWFTPWSRYQPGPRSPAVAPPRFPLVPREPHRPAPGQTLPSQFPGRAASSEDPAGFKVPPGPNFSRGARVAGSGRRPEEETARAAVLVPEAPPGAAQPPVRTSRGGRGLNTPRNKRNGP